MPPANRGKERTISILNRLFGEYSGPAFNVQFWDGSTWDKLSDQSPQFTLVLNHPGALKHMFLPPTERSLGEAYVNKDFDLEGDIYQAFDVGEHIQNQKWAIAETLWYAWHLWNLPDKGSFHTKSDSAQVSGEIHSLDRDRQAVSYHYDVSNDFYALWLDKNMLYSCAYYPEKGLDIHSAQEKKMEYICKKLRLKSGERLLDIGCGWGGQIIHAAKHYGVKAVGITLSENQAEWARNRIEEEGLEGQCEVKLMDYREIPPGTSYDKIVSVGMVEHVGREKLLTYFKQAYRLLEPQGLFLNHGIASMDTDPNRKRPTEESFGDNYVFPDGELVLINTMLRYAEEAGFEVLDVESLREHYAQTLRHWVHRLEGRHQEALQHVEETTYRIWRLFMSGSARGFEVGRLNLYQSLLGKPSKTGKSGLPRTRKDLYM